MIKFISTIPLSQTLHLPLPTMLPPYPLVLQSPDPHIHWKFAINMSKLLPTQKNREKLTIKLISTTPLPPTRLPLFSQRLIHNTLARQFPTPHIHLEIANFIPPSPLPKKHRKSQKLQFMIKLLSAIPLHPKLHVSLPMMPPHNTLYQQSPTPHIIEKS